MDKSENRIVLKPCCVLLDKSEVECYLKLERSPENKEFNSSFSFHTEVDLKVEDNCISVSPMPTTDNEMLESTIKFEENEEHFEIEDDLFPDATFPYSNESNETSDEYQIKTEQNKNSVVAISKDVALDPKILSSCSIIKKYTDIALHLTAKIGSDREKPALHFVITSSIKICDNKIKILTENGKFAFSSVSSKSPVKVCKLCVFISPGFKKNLTMFQHVSNTHDIKYQCRSCEGEIMPFSQFEKHLIETHSLNKTTEVLSHTIGQILNESKELQAVFSCVPCDTVMYGSDGVSLFHCIVKHFEKHCICKICGTNFSSNEELQKHSENHSKSYKVLQCSFCNIGFRRLKILQEHVENLCDFKNIKLKESNNIYHEKDEHFSSYEYSNHNFKYFDCPLCVLKFSTTATNFLCKHISSHKTSTCDLCCELFILKKDGIAQGEKNPVCDICIIKENAQFKFNPRLNFVKIFERLNVKSQLPEDLTKITDDIVAIPSSSQNKTATCPVTSTGKKQTVSQKIGKLSSSNIQVPVTATAQSKCNKQPRNVLKRKIAANPDSKHSEFKVNKPQSSTQQIKLAVESPSTLIQALEKRNLQTYKRLKTQDSAKKIETSPNSTNHQPTHPVSSKLKVIQKYSSTQNTEKHTLQSKDNNEAQNSTQNIEMLSSSNNQTPMSHLKNKVTLTFTKPHVPKNPTPTSEDNSSCQSPTQDIEISSKVSSINEPQDQQAQKIKKSLTISNTLQPNLKDPEQQIEITPSLNEQQLVSSKYTIKETQYNTVSSKQQVFYFTVNNDKCSIETASNLMNVPTVKVPVIPYFTAESDQNEESNDLQ